MRIKHETIPVEAVNLRMTLYGHRHLIPDYWISEAFWKWSPFAYEAIMKVSFRFRDAQNEISGMVEERVSAWRILLRTGDFRIQHPVVEKCRRLSRSRKDYRKKILQEELDTQLKLIEDIMIANLDYPHRLSDKKPLDFYASKANVNQNLYRAEICPETAFYSSIRSTDYAPDSWGHVRLTQNAISFSLESDRYYDENCDADFSLSKNAIKLMQTKMISFQSWLNAEEKKEARERERAYRAQTTKNHIN